MCVAGVEPAAYAETDSARLFSQQRADPEVAAEVFVALVEVDLAFVLEPALSVVCHLQTL